MQNSLNNNNNQEDKLIKELFNDFTPEKAPKSLKSKTMNRIFKDWSESAVVYKPIINKENRIWIIVSLAAISALAFIIDISVLTEYWQQLNIDNSFINSTNLNQSFGKLIITLRNIPSVLYFIGIGFIILAGIDKFFSRLANI